MRFRELKRLPMLQYELQASNYTVDITVEVFQIQLSVGIIVMCTQNGNMLYRRQELQFEAPLELCIE